MPTVYVIARKGRKHYSLKWKDQQTHTWRFKQTDIPATGKPREQKQAEKAAAQMAAQLEAGQAVTPSRLTWADFRQMFEEHGRHEASDATKSSQQTTLDHLEDTIRPSRLWDVDDAAIRRWETALRNGKRSPATVAKYLRTLRAVLNWAVGQKLLPALPTFPKSRRADSGSKGRPLTAEEFERMLAVVPDVVGDSRAGHWQRYLTALWLSGLRLNESLSLHWDRGDRPHPQFQRDGRPLLFIPKQFDKARRERLLPLAPEFAQMLMATREEDRRGLIFPLPMERHYEEPTDFTVSKIIAKIGRKACVVVNEQSRKTATAHDLRRSFAARWARLLMPADLQALMRHENIETTLRYYVGSDARATADAAWKALESTPLGDNLGDNATTDHHHRYENP